MLNGFIKSIVFILCLLFVNAQATASSQYQEYQAYEDSQGNIYLKLPKQFVLIHSDVSIPLMVYPKNALVRLYEENGVWKIQILTEAQFNALTLSPSNYAVEYIDFSGDGDVEVVLRADSTSDDSFILYGLENGSVSFSVHNGDTSHGDGVDLSQGSGARFFDAKGDPIDVNGDGYIDIQYSDYTLLGNAQDKFFSTKRYEANQASLIGATGGDFRVAEDGSATYQIPLKLPQGVAGVTPQMAFSYSSNGGNGVLGRGWALSGLTNISRCPKNYAQDGHIAGVTLAIDDAYCLNGQRLILTTGTHGVKNATYHTELATFSVVTVSSANESGATSFEVTTKSGETHYYGISSNNPNAYGGRSSAPSVYLISTIEDVKQNQINYHYIHNNNIDEVNLDKITWGAANFENELKVNYANSPKPHYGYRYGRESGQTQFVKNVEVSQSGTLTRRYNIAWDHGVVSGNDTPVAENISRVTDIQECLIDNGEEHCLSASSFNWSSLQTGSKTVRVCKKYIDMGDEDFIEGRNRHQCILWGSETIAATFTPFGSQKNISLDEKYRNSERNLPADADGDGISDIYYIKDDKWALIKVSASGEGATRTLGYSYKTSSYSRGKYDYAQVADTDGDGRLEVIYPDSGNWYKLYLTESGSLSRTSIGSYSDKDYERTVLLDVDGDSFIDMVTKRDTGLLVRYNNAGVFNYTTQTLVSDNISVNSSGNASKVHIQTPKLKNTAFLDINGDGISDFLSVGTIPEYHCEKYTYDYGQIPFAQSPQLDASVSSSTSPSSINSGGSWGTVYYGFSRTDVQTECDRLESTDYSDARYRVVTKSLTRPVALIGSVSSAGVPNYNDFYHLNFLHGVDLEQDVRIADFNGDGLSDIIYRFSEQWQIAISRGNGTFTIGSILKSTLNGSDSNKYNYHRFADINGDGLTDLLSYSGSGFLVYLAQANQGAVPSFIYRLSISVDVDDNKQMHFADFDGDSQLDILYEQGSNMRYQLAAQPQQRKNVINLITSGFGQTTDIQYGLLQNDNTRIQSGSSYFDNLSNNRRPSSATYYGTYYKSDFVQPNVGMWVVTNVANIGYDSYGSYQDDTDRNKAISIGYRYSGMLLHKLGRGSLGFELLETTDNTTGIKTTTKYSQAYPHVGMPISTVQSYDGKVLSEASNVFSQTWSTKYGTFPFVDVATDKKWRLLTNNSVAFASRSTLDSDYDSFGNLTSSTSKQFSSLTGSTVLAKVETTNVYNGAGGGAEKGRLSSASVTHTRGSVSKTRSSTFGYYADGMLEWSKINGLNQKTTYEYNARGSKEKVCVLDETTGEQRCSSTQWSPDGRFVLSATNALQQSETYLYNGQAGSVNGRIWSKTTTGPNGIASTQYFDIQGQLIKEQRADGNTSHITRAFYSATHLDNCVANSQKLCFSETRTSSGKPSSTVWYDAYGRKVKTQTRAFDGSQWASQYFTFDALSRGKSTTEPYYESSSHGAAPSSLLDKTTYSYDVLGRVTREQLPDGAVNKREYYALHNDYIDGENNRRIEHVNALGELVKVTSAVHNIIVREIDDETALQAVDSFEKESPITTSASDDAGIPVPPNIVRTYVRTITDYQYDVFGKLTKVSNYASNNTSKKISIYTLYDNEGRKTAMYDPDKGHWQYTYNAFGELKTQTSANDLVTSNYYDLLGRKTKSTEQALGNYSATVSCFHYGNNAAAKNVGKLIKQQQFTSSNSALASFDCKSKVNATATWQQSVSFDQLGRLAATTTTFEGKSFTQSQTYDAYSRVSTQTLPEGLMVTTQYQHGYLKRVKQGILTLREISSMDAAGRVTGEVIGQGMSKINTFDAVGRVESINLTTVGGQTLHHLSYGFDYVGNLTQRSQNYAGGSYFSEGFVYDSINRVKERSIDYRNLDVTQLDDAFAYQQKYEYDFIGNITQKYSYTTTPAYVNPFTGESREAGEEISNHYNYNYQWQTHVDSTASYPLRRSGLHNIQKDTNSNYRNYSYDANGNVTDDGSRDYQYTPFDKPWKITSASSGATQSSEFKYANRSRYMRLDNIQEQQADGSNYGALTQYKTHYVGAYERVERTGGKGNQVEHKYQIAGAVLTRKEGETNFKTLFAHTDYQGSVITVTDQVGQIAEQFIYDPWGKKTKVIITNQVGSLVSGLTRGSATTRGYTGHEGIDHFDLIHMNGRVYDAEIGRFLQADPNIQAPTNSQNYNRYSYVLNNPMSYTDPTGYFFKKLKSFVKKYWKVAVQIGIGILTGGAGFAWALAGGALSGYIATGSLKGALIGAASAALFYGAGEIISAAKVTGALGKAFIRGVAGGISSTLSGGKFGHGFVAAGAATLGGGKIDKAFSSDAGRIIASATLGGTMSKITGGKFANGAITAAFMKAYNDANHRQDRGSPSNPDEPLAKWFKSIHEGAAAIRGSIEKTLTDIKVMLSPYKNSHGGGTVGAAWHVVLAGTSHSIYNAIDGNGQMCAVEVQCARFGPGVLIDGGPGAEINLANTPQLIEGATETTVGAFVEGGEGLVGGASIDIGTQDLMPSGAIGFKGVGIGAAAGIQVCEALVLDCI